MTARNEIYKCNLCGNIVEVLHPAGGALACCGQDMVLLNENKVDAAVEKHVPVIEKVDGGVLVKVGDVAHPMQDDHYIEWIELSDGDKVYKAFLSPGDAPEALFEIEYSEGLVAREYCNLHGLWKV